MQDDIDTLKNIVIQRIDGAYSKTSISDIAEKQKDLIDRMMENREIFDYFDLELAQNSIEANLTQQIQLSGANFSYRIYIPIYLKSCLNSHECQTFDLITFLIQQSSPNRPEYCSFCRCQIPSNYKDHIRINVFMLKLMEHVHFSHQNIVLFPQTSQYIAKTDFERAEPAVQDQLIQYFNSQAVEKLNNDKIKYQLSKEVQNNQRLISLFNFDKHLRLNIPIKQKECSHSGFYNLVEVLNTLKKNNIGQIQCQQLNQICAENQFIKGNQLQETIEFNQDLHLLLMKWPSFVYYPYTDGKDIFYDEILRDVLTLKNVLKDTLDFFCLQTILNCNRSDFEISQLEQQIFSGKQWDVCLQQEIMENYGRDIEVPTRCKKCECADVMELRYFAAQILDQINKRQNPTCPLCKNLLQSNYQSQGLSDIQQYTDSIYISKQIFSFINNTKNSGHKQICINEDKIGEKPKTQQQIIKDAPSFQEFDNLYQIQKHGNENNGHRQVLLVCLTQQNKLSSKMLKQPIRSKNCRHTNISGIELEIFVQNKLDGTYCLEEGCNVQLKAEDMKIDSKFIDIIKRIKAQCAEYNELQNEIPANKMRVNYNIANNMIIQVNIKIATALAQMDKMNKMKEKNEAFIAEIRIKIRQNLEAKYEEKRQKLINVPGVKVSKVTDKQVQQEYERIKGNVSDQQKYVKENKVLPNADNVAVYNINQRKEKYKKMNLQDGSIKVKNVQTSKIFGKQVIQKNLQDEFQQKFNIQREEKSLQDAEEQIAVFKRYQELLKKQQIEEEQQMFNYNVESSYKGIQNFNDDTSKNFFDNDKLQFQENPDANLFDQIDKEAKKQKIELHESEIQQVQYDQNQQLLQKLNQQNKNQQQMNSQNQYSYQQPQQQQQQQQYDYQNNQQNYQNEQNKESYNFFKNQSGIEEDQSNFFDQIQPNNVQSNVEQRNDNIDEEPDLFQQLENNQGINQVYVSDKKNLANISNPQGQQEQIYQANINYPQEDTDMYVQLQNQSQNNNFYPQQMEQEQQQQQNLHEENQQKNNYPEFEEEVSDQQQLLPAQNNQNQKQRRIKGYKNNQ